MATEADVHRFFNYQRKQEQAFKYARRQPDPRHILAGRIEQQVKARLAAFSYQVSSTANNERFDLWCEGVRIEVKASQWNGRYQCNLRGNDADLLILVCITNPTAHFFVIPWKDLGNRKNVAIWSEQPDDYRGQWARYQEAWHHLHELVKNPPPSPWQLPLF